MQFSILLPYKKYAMNVFERNSKLLPIENAGEMASLILQKDWSQTEIGDIENWDIVLKSTLTTIVHSKFAHFIFWGKEDLFCFYNDAYRPSLGSNGKHPTLLGQRAKDGWIEIWHIIKPLIDDILSGKKAHFFEDALVPIERNGKIEDVYWSFCYSPIYDTNGTINGVLVTTTETTEKVNSLKALNQNVERFNNMLLQAPVGICLISGPDLTFELGNDYYFQIIQRTASEAIDKKVFDVLPEAKETAEPILRNVYETGVPFYANEFKIPIFRNNQLEDVYFNFVYNPIKDREGKIEGIIVIVSDVSDIVKAKLQAKENEERLRLATESGKLATWEINFITNEFSYSNYLLELYELEANKKYSLEEMRKVVIPEDRIGIDFNKALEKSFFEFEARAKLSTNKIKWVKVMAKVFYDDDKKPLKVVGTVQDITEAKNYNQFIEESEKRYRFLADTMPQFVWTTNAQGDVTYWNEATFEYTGLTKEELCENWLQIIHPDDRENNIKVWINSVNTKEPYLFEHRFKNKDGIYRWQLSRALPLLKDNGEVDMWIGTSTDIDDIKKHEQQKNDFIKMANHELKTPVTTIKGYVQLLMKTHGENANDPMLHSSLKTINNQVNKLTSLIENLLDVSRIESGSLPLHKEIINIQSIIKEAIQDIQTTTKTHTIQLNYEAGENIFVYADKEKITQVLLNLYTNAIKYSPKSNLIVTTVSAKNKEVIISIQDFGIGIDKEHLPNLFKRFFRVPGEIEKTFPGFGIGLHIVQEILHHHNGKVWVESEKDKGSTFYIALPIHT